VLNFIIYCQDEVCDVVISQVIICLSHMNNKNNILSKKSVLFQMAIVLSAVMLATSAIPSLVQTKAFAQDDPIQTDVNTDANVEADVDVIKDEGDCAAASDETTQESLQSTDQQSSSDDENIPQVLTSANTAVNVAVTPDVDLTGECNPSDETTQGVEQSSNQQPDTEASDAYTTSVNTARNIAVDPDRSVN
jgi:hypothetical protein